MKMKMLRLNDYSYIIRFEKKYTKKQFLMHSHVSKDSFAENFVIRIYNEVIGNAIDVKKEFEKYYSDEYISIKDFLFWNYLVPTEYLDELFADYKRGTFIGIFKDFSWFYDEQEDIMTRTILEFLEELDK